MRCSCQRCDTYMVHAESLHLGCVCPECGYRCRACLGTDTVIERAALKDFSRDPAFLTSMLSALSVNEEDDAGFGRGDADMPENPDPWLD